MSLRRIVDALAGNHVNHVEFHKHPASENRTLSFDELHRKVIEIGAWLDECGVGPNANVIVIGENGLAALAIDLALIAASCTTIHVLEEPFSLRQSSIEDVRIDFVVSTPRCAGHLDEGELIRIDSLDGLFLYAPRSPQLGDDLDNVPALIFSSGTTGVLKRIIVDPIGVAYNAKILFEHINPDRDDVFLLFLPFSNYQQKLVAYGCILAGVDFCVCEPSLVLNALRDVQPTLFLAPPLFFESVWKLASDRGQPSPEKLRDFFGARLKLAWSGMAPISLQLLRGFANAGLPILEAYGLTEFGPVALNTLGASRLGSVGRPVKRDSVVIAADGEILLRSRSPLTRGYLGLSRAVQEEIYRPDGIIATGDLGWRDQDGYVYVQGRKKELIVTSSGHKIHPHSVEQNFSDISGIARTVVFGNARPQLGLLVFAEPDKAPDLAALEARIDAVNRGVCKAYPIKHLFISDSAPSVGNGLLTRNLKLNRPRLALEFETDLFNSSPALRHDFPLK